MGRPYGGKFLTLASSAKPLLFNEHVLENELYNSAID